MSEWSPAVLNGPMTPTWSCSLCQTSGRWASRIKCRSCSRDAQNNTFHAAKRAAKIAPMRPASGSVKGKRHDFAKLHMELRSEVAKQLDGRFGKDTAQEVVITTLRRHMDSELDEAPVVKKKRLNAEIERVLELCGESEM